MPKLPRRKCKVCNEWFHPAYDNIRWCCPDHGAQYGLQQLDKKLTKQRAEKDKAERGEWRQRKPAVKPSDVPTLKGYTARLVDQKWLRLAARRSHA